MPQQRSSGITSFVAPSSAASLHGEQRAERVDHERPRLPDPAFIQAQRNGKDDCFEWFGGTSNHKHLVASGCADDAFDYQLGFTGSLQYAIVPPEWPP